MISGGIQMGEFLSCAWICPVLGQTLSGNWTNCTWKNILNH